MKIVSFGDSFIFGSELADNTLGNQAWPGLIAAELGTEYATLAVPGCGNDAIARQIIGYFANNTVKDTLAVVNWTWALRWDFYIVQNEDWVTLGPTCVPSTLKEKLDTASAAQLIDFYNTYTGKSILWNRWRSLQVIHSTQTYLKSIGVNSIETYMDPMLYQREYHAPDYVQILQDLTSTSMQTFEGSTFLDWSYARGYSVTDPGLHPLEVAHAAAKDLWITQYAEVLGIVR